MEESKDGTERTPLLFNATLCRIEPVLFGTEHKIVVSELYTIYNPYFYAVVRM